MRRHTVFDSSDLPGDARSPAQSNITVPGGFPCASGIQPSGLADDPLPDPEPSPGPSPGPERSDHRPDDPADGAAWAGHVLSGMAHAGHLA